MSYINKTSVVVGKQFQIQRKYCSDPWLPVNKLKNRKRAFQCIIYSWKYSTLKPIAQDRDDYTRFTWKNQTVNHFSKYLIPAVIKDVTLSSDIACNRTGWNWFCIFAYGCIWGRSLRVQPWPSESRGSWFNPTPKCGERWSNSLQPPNSNLPIPNFVAMPLVPCIDVKQNAEPRMKTR